MERVQLLPELNGPGPIGRVPLWLAALAVIAIYVASAAFAVRFVGAGPVASIWPSAALALVALLLGGWWMLPVILVADILALQVIGLPILPIAVVGNVVGPLAGAILYRRIVSLSPLPQKLRHTARLLFIVLPVQAAITTAFGVMAMRHAGMFESISTTLLTSSWWLGDLLGLVAFTPLFMAASTRFCGFSGATSARHPGFWPESVLVPTLTIVLAALAWYAPGIQLVEDQLGQSGLHVIVALLGLFVLIVWSALRLSPIITFCLVPLAVIGGIEYGLGSIEARQLDAVIGQWIVLLPTVLVMAATALLIEAGDRERDLFEKRLRYQSSHDPLTGLPNRRAFEQRVRTSLAQPADRTDCLLCYLDVDQFQAVNDTFGHAIGDEMLVELAECMSDILRPDDSIARLGGDEFGLLIQGAWEAEGKAQVTRLHRRIEDFRFVRSGKRFSVRASIGVTRLAGLPDDYDRLLSTADTACIAAKEGGRNRIVFSAGPDQIHRRLSEAQQIPVIQSALDSGHIRLHSQPLVSLGGKRPNERCIEILCRLEDEAGELIFPDDFIPVAERSGLMPRLDRLVVGRTLAWLRDTPDRPDRCFINLSAASINEPGFARSLLDHIAQVGVDPALLGFEITETAAISNLDAANEMISQLHEAGCVVSLDDFGTGMSSFGHLHQLAVDFVKIDGQFVQHMSERPMNEAIVRSIAEIGRSSGIRTVAECVEDAETAAIVRELGIDYAQGYHFGRPAALQ